MFDRAGGLSDTTTVPWLRSQVTQLAVMYDVIPAAAAASTSFHISYRLSVIVLLTWYRLLTYLFTYLHAFVVFHCILWLKSGPTVRLGGCSQGGISVGSRGMWSLRWKGNQKYGFFRNTLTFAIFVTRSTCNSSFLVSFLWTIHNPLRPNFVRVG